MVKDCPSIKATSEQRTNVELTQRDTCASLYNCDFAPASLQAGGELPPTRRTGGHLKHKSGAGREHAARRAAAGARSAGHQHARDREQEVGALVLERDHLLLRYHLRQACRTGLGLG